LVREATDGDASRIRALLDDICATQCDDGSWASKPMLRLTAAKAHRPWSSPESGRIYADQRRIFTTATVVAAISEARSAISARSHAALIAEAEPLNDETGRTSAP
jgi:hypothetical protein